MFTDLWYKAQSSAPEDERNYRPKHIELIVIINKKFVIVAIGLAVFIIVSMMHRHTSIK